MHAVILHGGLHSDTGLEAVHAQLTSALQEAGWTVETLRVEEMDIHPCVGCFTCWLKTPGECAFADDGRRVTKAVIQSDARIFLTPVSFGGYSGLLKTAVDRLVPSVSPLFKKVNGEMHHLERYAHAPICLAVGWQQQANAESAKIFAELVHRNAINTHAPSEGSVVITSEHSAEAQQALIADLLRQGEVIR